MFATGKFTLRYCAAFLWLSALCAFVLQGTFVHAIDVAALVDSSDVIVSGTATSVTEEGRATINTACGSLAGKKLLLVLLPDETIKGAPEIATVSVELVIPDAPCAIRGVPPEQYGIFFLQQAGSLYKFSDPLYPYLPAVRSGQPSNGPPLDRVVEKLGEVLTREHSTKPEALSSLGALSTISTQSATETLRGACDKTTGNLRLLIASTLVSRNDLTGLGVIEKALLHPNTEPNYPFVNMAASLAGLKDPQAIPALKRLLQTHEPHITKGVAIALRQSGSADAEEPLSHLLNDNDKLVRYYAVVGLGEITRQDEWTPAFDEFQNNESKYLSYWRDWAASNVQKEPQK